MLVVALLILLSSCSSVVVVPFSYDVALCSDYPNDAINGKSIHSHLGLGGYNVVEDKLFTYPVAYIGSNYSIGTKDAVALGGLDLSNVKSDFKKARLKIFINYKDTTRKNVLLFVRPILNKWNDETTSFNFFYHYDYETNQYLLTENVSKDSNICPLVAFDVKANDDNDYLSIPFKSSYRTLSIDVTQIMKHYISDGYEGLLLDPMWQTDWRYCTTDESGQVSDTGVLEVATTEWYTFDSTCDGEVHFMKNNAVGKIKYVPRVEFVY